MKATKHTKTITALVIIILIVATAIGASFLLKKPAHKVNLTYAMASLQKKYPTVKQTYIYSESRDPNDNLKKPGYYTAGAEFYDTRTCLPKEDFGCEGSFDCKGAFGADCGGAIEVYPSSSDASKRVSYLKTFQGKGFLDPGVTKQVDNVVIRASRFYTSSEQAQVLNYLAGLVKQ